MRPLVWRLAALLLLAASPAAAQIRPCNPTGEPGVKVFLDDIVAATPGLTSLAHTIAGQIEQDIEHLRTESAYPVSVVACRDRRPTGPSDFQRPIVQQMLTSDVVLEVWGKAVELKDASGPYHQTEIGYVLVPVRFYEFGAVRPPGAFVLTHRTKPVQSVQDVVKLVNQAGRLGAYAALASGAALLKSTPLREKRWDPARSQLCRAAVTLGAMKKPRPEDTELAAYAERLAAEAVKGARSDSAYPGSGALKAVPVGASCPK
jgi:hypothetical protein